MRDRDEDDARRRSSIGAAILMNAICILLFSYSGQFQRGTDPYNFKGLERPAHRRRLRAKATSENGGQKQHDAPPPVIIIPGAMGSLLEGKLNKKKTVSPICYSQSDWSTLWITESALIASQCFFDNIKMRYLGNGKVDNNEGVEVRVPYYGGSVDGVRCLLSHTEFQCKATGNWLAVINELEARGYQVGEDLFSAPFDFRRGADDFMEDAFPRLKTLVEEVYHSNGGARVAFVSISIGSMFMHTFLTHYVDQEWKDKFVLRWLTMSGVFNGFAQSFQNVVFGRNQFLGAPIFKQTSVRDAYRTWASAAWLIPKAIYGDNRVILESPSRKYTLSDVGDALYDDQASMFRRSFLYNMTADPGVPTDCWFTKTKRTAVGYKIKQDMTKDLFYSQKGVAVKEIIGKGDGAADINSLNICESWPSTTVRNFGICHGCFVSKPSAVLAIADLFLGRTQDGHNVSKATQTMLRVDSVRGQSNVTLE